MYIHVPVCTMYSSLVTKPDRFDVGAVYIHVYSVAVIGMCIHAYCAPTLNCLQRGKDALRLFMRKAA